MPGIITVFDMSPTQRFMAFFGILAGLGILLAVAVVLPDEGTDLNSMMEGLGLGAIVAAAPVGALASRASGSDIIALGGGMTLAGAATTPGGNFSGVVMAVAGFGLLFAGASHTSNVTWRLFRSTLTYGIVLALGMYVGLTWSRNHHLLDSGDRRGDEPELDSDSGGCALNPTAAEKESVGLAMSGLFLSVVERMFGVWSGRGVSTDESDDAVVEWVITQNGKPIGIRRRSRKIPGWLRRLVYHRDGSRCQHPGCNNTRWLQVHHIIAWGDAGPTNLDNLILLCGVHHRWVHERDWHITGPPEARVFRRPEWTPHPQPRRPLHPRLAHLTSI